MSKLVSTTSAPGRHMLQLCALLAPVFLLAITSQSFWIDESAVVWFARLSSLAECWEKLESMRFPEIQVPLYMAYLWSYVRLFGAGEWAARAAGWPWLVVGAVVFSSGVGRAAGRPWLAALTVASSGFAWYYANEARVYAMQLGLALAMTGFAALVLSTPAESADGRRWRRWLLVSIFLLCACSILAAAWAVFIFAALMLLISPARWMNEWRAARGPVLFCLTGLVVLAGYYAWTMTLKAKPTIVGTTNWQTVVFVFYELLGAAGLGPARYELRGSGAAALRSYFPALALLAGVTGVVLWQGARELCVRFGARRCLLVAVLLLVPFVVLCGIGVQTRFRVLGRHITTLLPFVLVVLFFGLIRLLAARRASWRALAGFYLALALASCLSLRFSARHVKDDYRGAAALARVAVREGRQVWWNADASSAVYYGVVPGLESTAKVALVANPSAEELAKLPPPHVVISSKPDIYDNTGQVAAFLRAGKFRGPEKLPAFEIWRQD
jgi:hypothetical protein